MNVVYLGIGSNLGDRISYIIKALDRLKEISYVEKISFVYESLPFGMENQPKFLNFVAKIQTNLGDFELLKTIKQIEKDLGRQERPRWYPREIDIDILLFNKNIILTKPLEVPHPYILERDFFYYPLLEVDPEVYHPLKRAKLKDINTKPINRLEFFSGLYI
jgi:2-amino-4-hydroxy-6-hydroxymethyldihydropteridine diphosphokinase